MRFRKFAALMAVLLALMIGASVSMAQEVECPDGWSEESHSNDAELNYDVAFPQDDVNTITITIAPETWAAMLEDMTNLYGEFGSREGMGFPGAGGVIMLPPDGELPEGFDPGQPPPEGFELPAGQDGQPPRDFVQGGPGGLFPDENPIWVPVTVEFDGHVWTNVGMRFKGNSTLSGTWGEGSYKLPFRLDFDEFEDDYPEIDNQRFYGFQKLSFSSNFRDSSYLHEKMAADIFRDAGVAASQTAFYAVYVDYGEGPVYWGLYTASEMVDDTVIETQFADDSGNLYKPEDGGANFVEGMFSEENFEKETNEDDSDWSDILALFEALHADTRTTDPEAWRAGLEAVLDVDAFLRWLAVNTTIQNWDTYGTMAHNYYLYNDPTTGLLTWIPWDNNEALTGGGGMRIVRRGGEAPAGAPPQGAQGGPHNMMGGPGGSVAASGSLDLTSTGDNWPLISYLINDPVYQEIYNAYVEETINGAFEPQAMEAEIRRLHELISPYVVGGDGQDADLQLESSQLFANSQTELIAHVNSRYEAATEYLAAQ